MASKISVIIPCYNQAQYLEETLQSVINQTYSVWECIVVNDGSTDKTEEIANKWCKLDARFKYVYKENGGLSSARNAGLRVAKGKYIQLLDADDLIKPYKFEKQLKDLEHAQVSISDYFSFVDGDLEKSAKHRYLSPFLSEVEFKKEIILDWEYRKSIPCHSVIFEKELLEKNNITFNENLPNHEDWVFWVQVLSVSKEIINNYEVLALYRIKDNSMSTDFTLMKQGFLDAAKSLEIYFKNNELVNSVKVKQKEIYNKNRIPFYKKIKSKTYSKLASLYRYVKKN
jgi:glycosyltransferase involved in cell wall biosynthesis